MAVAFMTFPVMVLMMVTARIRIIFQVAFGKRLCRVIRAAGYTGIQLNSCFSQCHLSTSADSTADQGICLNRLHLTGLGMLIPPCL